MVHGELVGVFGEVEDDGNGDDEDDGEEVGPQELGDDVAVEPGEEVSKERPTPAPKKRRPIPALSIREGVAVARLIAFFILQHDSFLYLVSFLFLSPSLGRAGVGLLLGGSSLGWVFYNL
jgi:hypothetical protein